jgi:hypothetical protein
MRVANQITGGGLVIGGTADAQTTFTINPSDSNGNPRSSGPIAELVWAPNAITFQSGSGPLVFTWTAVSDGSYTVNASVSPSSSSGSQRDLPLRVRADRCDLSGDAIASRC